MTTHPRTPAIYHTQHIGATNGDSEDPGERGGGFGGRVGARYSPLARTPLKKISSINTPPTKNPTKTEPQAQTRNSAKNENGVSGISALRGFRKGFICHVFREKNGPFSIFSS